MTSHAEQFLLRVNFAGEVTDASGKQYRLVPVEPTEAMYRASFSKSTDKQIYLAMLSAATVDLERMAVDAPVMFVAREHLHERPVGLRNPVRVQTCYALAGHKEPTPEQVQAVRDLLGAAK